MPEDTELARSPALVPQRLHRRVDAQHLMVLRQHLDRPAGTLEIGDEVLDHVD